MDTNYIVNKQIKTIESLGSIGYATRVALFAPLESYVLYDTDQPTIVDMIEWVPNNSSQCDMAIYVKGGDNGGEHITADGANVTSWSAPVDIANGVLPYFDIIRYDLPNAIFKFQLKKSIICPQGIRVTLRNINGTVSFRNSCHIVYRTII